MPSIPEALSIAVTHHRAGRLHEAEQIYRQILAVDPHQADALHLLGVVAHSSGQHAIAIECIQRALRVNPGEPMFHNNLGNAYRDQGQRAEAISCYRQALQLKPGLCETYVNLGIALNEERRRDEAIDCFRRALDLRPGLIEARHLLGTALRNSGKIAEALDCLHRALEFKPDDALTLNHLGNLWMSQGELAKAVEHYRRATSLDPDGAQFHSNLGGGLLKLGQFVNAIACFQRALRLQPEFSEAWNLLGTALLNEGRIADATEAYERAIAIEPGYAEAHNNLGSLLLQQARFPEAIAALERALQCQPDHAEAHYNLGLALQEQSQFSRAVACYQRALQLKPDFPEAHSNLCVALAYQGELPEIIACYQRALQFRPDDVATIVESIHYRQHACLWGDHEDAGESRQVQLRRVRESLDQPAIAAAAEPIAPFPFLALPVATTAGQQRQCAARWAERRFKWAMETGRQSPLFKAGAAPRPPQTPLRIGYLSADFRLHAVAQSIVELFEKHDRLRFIIHAYSYGHDDGSPVRKRIEAAVDRFVDLKSVSHAEAAKRIAADGIDVLVDLAGYTGTARTQILALRPAPVQVNYLGYPGTMGASFIDYILVDDYVVPPDQQAYFTEKLVHLPGCYLPGDSQRAVSAPPSRAECALPESGFVFCSFNNSYKITPELFAVWMTLLREVTGSVLWLSEANRFVAANLQKEAELRGVSADRLVFAPRLPSLADHLARYRVADLFLDTFPYNAHATASDALWASCPLLTYSGETFASRVAGSLLRTIGLPELITTSLSEYHDTALRLTRDADLLSGLRGRLESNRLRSGLFDSQAFARHIEQAYTRMWETYTDRQSSQDKVARSSR